MKLKGNIIKVNQIKLSLALSLRLSLALAALLGAQWASAQTLISWCSDEHFDSRITVSEAYQDSDGVAQAMDIDKDDDGLIEICDLEGLNAIRYVLDGSGYKDTTDATTNTSGCPSTGCRGYELVRHLDFLDDASYRTTANKGLYTEGLGWHPIGDRDNSFTAHFNGNRYTVANLRINRPATSFIALFSSIDNATIENLGLLNVDIVGRQIVSGLVSIVWTGGANIRNNYVVGGHIAGTGRVGGLIGLVRLGTKAGNYTRVAVTGSRSVGGLVGLDAATGIWENNYAAGTVSGPFQVGGLVGLMDSSPSFNYNYAAAAVTGVSDGGFAGDIFRTSNPTFKHNYWDTTRSGQSSSVGQGAGKIEGFDTAAMQAATAPGTTTTEIYYGWSEAHWDFGTSTQYPALRYRSGNVALGHRVGDLLPYQFRSLRDLQLTTASGPLAIDFRTDNLEYHHRVSYDVAEVMVTATTETGATLRINGTQAISGEPQTVALAIATTTTIAIEVFGAEEVVPTIYTITIFRPVAPLLAELALSHGTFQPSFDINIREHTLHVAYEIVSLAVTTATAFDPNATIEVYRNGLDAASRIVPRDEEIALDEGAMTTIRIRVTVADGDEAVEQIYRIVVTRAPSSDATLAVLGFAHAPTLINFAAATYQYSVSIEGLLTVDLVLRTANEHARVAVQRDASVVVTNEFGNYPIALMIGTTTTIQIMVTAQDSIATQNYTITLMQQPGTQAELTELRLSDRGGKPLPLTVAEAPQYTAMVSAVRQVRLSLEVSPGAWILVRVSNQIVSPIRGNEISYYPINLALGAATTTTIAVTSQDGNARQDYTLVITHTLSSDASLRGLRVQLPSGTTQIPLNPPFTSGLFDYNAAAAVQSQYIVRVQPSTGAMVVSVHVGNTPARRLNIGGAAYYLVDLAVGAMTSVAIQTLSQDNTTRENYTLTIRHTPGTNADLATLRVTDTFGARLPLDFNPSVNHYTVSAQGAPHVVVQASGAQTERRLADDGRVREVSVARVTVNGTALSSNTPSAPIPLNLTGNTTITFIVTAQDGIATKDYSLVIRPISDATAFLGALSLSEGSLNPPFSTATLSYTISNTSTTPLILIPQANLGATLQVLRTVAARERIISANAHGAYRIAFSRTTATVVITVTARDGKTTRTYTFAVSPLALRPSDGIRIRSRLFLEAPLP